MSLGIFDMPDSIPGGTMYLGRTTQSIGVLNTGTPFVGRHDAAIVGESAHVVGCSHLAWVGSDSMDVGVKLSIAAHEHLQGHGTGNIGQFRQTLSIMEDQCLNGGHHLGTIDQGQTLPSF